MLGFPKIPATLDSLGWINRPVGLSNEALLYSLGGERMPFIFLIGPDGKVLAKDLHGAAIKDAVTNAMAEP